MMGCSPVIELAKSIWGSSTRALEKARSDAVKQTFSCTRDKCFDDIVDFAQVSLSAEDLEKKNYEVFIKDRKRGLIVVMDVPGCTDTTEVGIFLTDLAPSGVTIEISSLSENAKHNVADMLLGYLSLKYPAHQQ